MSCANKQENSVVERQPLHANQEEEEHTENGRPNGNTETVVSLIEHHPEETNKNQSKIPSYAIDPAYQNTMENPYRETTVTLPHLVRKVPSCDLTPQPWHSFNQVLILSYISIVFCCCIGVFANRNAWKAKTLRGKGLYGVAQKRAKMSVYCSYAGVGVGILIIIIVLAAVFA